MAKIKWEFETLYDRGDTVLFDYHGITRVGEVQSFYMEDHVIWYNIVSDGQLFSYSSNGDIAEFDILGKITDNSLLDKIHGRNKADE